MIQPAKPPSNPERRALLERAGVYRVEHFLGYGVISVNLYLCLGPPLCLIDTGVDTPTAPAELAAAVTALGGRLNELRHIFLTHAHVDHAGLAVVLAREFGAQIWIHPEEAPRMDGRQYVFFTGHLPIMLRRLGADDEQVKIFMKAIRGIAEAYRIQKTDKFLFLSHGQKLPIEGLDLEVFHTPGHSRGSVCFLEKRLGLCFSGDTLLPQGPPRNIISPESENAVRFDGLMALEKSLEALNEILPQTVLSGHGPPAAFQDLIPRARANLKKRRADLLKVLVPHTTTSGLVTGRFRPDQALNWLMHLTETRAALEALVSEGVAIMEAEDGVEYFSPA